MSGNVATQDEGLSKTDLIQQFWNFRTPFLRRIHSMISNHDLAEDVFQEACLRFLASTAVFEYPAAGTRYFCMIIRSIIMQHHRTGWRLQYRSSLPEAVCDPSGEWDKALLMDRVSSAIAVLPETDRDLLTMYFEQGLTLRDKCKALHLPNSTMRYQAARAISRIKRMVTGDSIGIH